MIVPANEENIERAAQIIRAGGLVAFPTETVYGLGADARNESAVRKIFSAKGRPSHNPLIVHIGSIDMLPSVADLRFPGFDRGALQHLQQFWPGPLSIVLPKVRGVAPSACGGLQSVAVRMPNHSVAQALIEKSGTPIAAPSANRSNYISATSAQHVAADLGAAVDLILDGGPVPVGIESTIVSLATQPAKLLRPGAITLEQLAMLLPEIEISESLPTESVLAPGMLRVHYSPNTRLIFRGSQSPDSFPARVGLICFQPNGPTLEYPYERVAVLSESGDLAEVSARLFACLREFDSAGLDLIVVDSCPTVGLGRAIMDRLLRASA